MNWSDMKKNHNKFYVCQALKEKGSSNDRAWVYTRYGRVGVPGVKGLESVSKDRAVQLYEKKIKEKLRKGYTEIKVISAEKGKSKPANVSFNSNCEPSKLDTPLQTLMSFFFDKTKMESSIASVNVDVKKMPLG